MENRRREFLKLSGLAVLDITTGGTMKGFASALYDRNQSAINLSNSNNSVADKNINEKNLSIIGLYGVWANAFNENKFPSFSFRKKEWSDVETWQKAARQRLAERLAIPEIGGVPKVNVIKQYSY